MKAVARQLGNTRTVCRGCYIHPEIINCYMDGFLARIILAQTEKRLRQRLSGMKPEEAAVLALLQRRLAAPTGGGSGRARKSA